MTPLFVETAEDIPLMNFVWFIPAVVGCIITALKVGLNIASMEEGIKTYFCTNYTILIILCGSMFAFTFNCMGKWLFFGYF